MCKLQMPSCLHGSRGCSRVMRTFTSHIWIVYVCSVARTTPATNRVAHVQRSQPPGWRDHFILQRAIDVLHLDNFGQRTTFAMLAGEFTPRSARPQTSNTARPSSISLAWHERNNAYIQQPMVSCLLTTCLLIIRQPLASRA